MEPEIKAALDQTLALRRTNAGWVSDFYNDKPNASINYEYTPFFTEQEAYLLRSGFDTQLVQRSREVVVELNKPLQDAQNKVGQATKDVAAVQAEIDKKQQELNEIESKLESYQQQVRQEQAQFGEVKTDFHTLMQPLETDRDKVRDEIKSKQVIDMGKARDALVQAEKDLAGVKIPSPPTILPVNHGQEIIRAYRNGEKLILLRGDVNSASAYKLLRLDHPNIPKVTPVHLNQRVNYLWNRPASLVRLTAVNAEIAAQLTDVLSYIHSQGFALGPQPNIYLATSEGNQGGKVYVFPGFYTTRVRPGEVMQISPSGVISQDDDWKMLGLTPKTVTSVASYPTEYKVPAGSLDPTQLAGWIQILKSTGVDWGFTYMEMLMTLVGLAPSVVPLVSTDINQALLSLTGAFASTLGKAGINYLRTPLNFYLNDAQSSFSSLLSSPQNLLTYQSVYDSVSGKLPTGPQSPQGRIFMTLPFAPIVAPTTPPVRVSEFKLDTGRLAVNPTLTGYRKISGVSYPVNVLQTAFNDSLVSAKVSELKDEKQRISTQDFITVEAIELLHKFITGDVLPAQFYATLDDKSFKSLIGNNILGLYHSDLTARHYIDMNFIYGRDLVDQFGYEPLDFPADMRPEVKQYLTALGKVGQVESTAVVKLESKGGIESPSFSQALAALPTERKAVTGATQAEVAPTVGRRGSLSGSPRSTAGTGMGLGGTATLSVPPLSAQSS